VEVCGGGVRLTYYVLLRGEHTMVAKVVLPVAAAGEQVIKLLAEKRHMVAQEGPPTVQ
jgi:hypothetical protein